MSDACVYGSFETGNGPCVVETDSGRDRIVELMVHDLQNPLFGIRSGLQHLRELRERPTDEDREVVEEAIRRCDDLAVMIQNVLYLSRGDAGRLEAVIQEVDVAAIARDLTASIRMAATGDQRSLVLCAPLSLRWRTDPALLARILQNLLRNSIRHTPSGTKVLVLVETELDGLPRLSVIDDGPGIPLEIQPLLFGGHLPEKLRRLGLRVDTGLGLASCRAAADAIGAELRVESDGRHGTSFVLTLPREASGDMF